MRACVRARRCQCVCIYMHIERGCSIPVRRTGGAGGGLHGLRRTGAHSRSRSRSRTSIPASDATQLGHGADVNKRQGRHTSLPSPPFIAIAKKFLRLLTFPLPLIVPTPLPQVHCRTF